MSGTPNNIVITGMGAVTPYGVGTDILFDALVEGRTTVRLTEDETLQDYAPVSSQILDFNALDYLPAKLVRDTSRFTQLALVAAMKAIDDAKLPLENGKLSVPGVSPARIGIFFGNGFGGTGTMDEASRKLAVDEKAKVGPRLVSKSVPNAAAGGIAAYFGVYGPVLTYVTACASSANAIGEAMLWLESGRIDVAIAGGTDSLLAPTLLAGLYESGALATRGQGPAATWSKPFDRNRIGMVPGEGAAVVIMERGDNASERGVQIHANLIGYGTSNDGYHQIAPEPNGRGAALAMRQALASAGLQPEDIDYINAHATATKAGDSAESKALWDVFGDAFYNIPVNSIKGHIGHVLAGAGAIECVANVKSLQTGLIPPTLNCDDVDDGAPPNLVRNQAQQKDIRTVLSSSFGFGGQNAVIILQKAEV